MKKRPTRSTARRAAEVGAEELPNSGFPDALDDVAALRESEERIAKPLRALRRRCLGRSFVMLV